MENRARRPRDVAALVLEPHLEPRAGPERQPVQQLVAEPGYCDRLRPGRCAQDLDVDEGSRRKGQPDRIPAELEVSQPATKSGQRPAKRSQGIVRLGKEQAGKALPRWSDASPNEVDQKPPRLVAARGIDGDAAPLHPRRPQQVDAQAHAGAPCVTRAVTRRTITLPLLEFNGSHQRREER
jgi:hypothetical protein